MYLCVHHDIRMLLFVLTTWAQKLNIILLACKKIWAKTYQTIQIIQLLAKQKVKCTCTFKQWVA